MNQAENEMPDDPWFVTQIEKAKSMERLEFIAEVINKDKENGVQYTKCTPYMQQVRDAWAARRAHLQKQHKETKDE